MLQPWEYFEREIAQALGGYRISRNETHRESAPDIVVRDFDLVVDAKLRRGFLHHEFVRAIATKYCHAGEIPVLVSREPGRPGTYLTLPFEHFAFLLNATRQLVNL